jgi:hypothetical protein
MNWLMLRAKRTNLIRALHVSREVALARAPPNQ